ncbi:hypothetical protein GCM10023069_48310 [Shinella granuli]
MPACPGSARSGGGARISRQVTTAASFPAGTSEYPSGSIDITLQKSCFLCREAGLVVKRNDAVPVYRGKLSQSDDAGGRVANVQVRRHGHNSAGRHWHFSDT